MVTIGLTDMTAGNCSNSDIPALHSSPGAGWIYHLPAGSRLKSGLKGRITMILVAVRHRHEVRIVCK